MMIKKIQILFAQKQLLRQIVLKEIKAKYSSSLLGLTWAVITPLLIMGVINFVFTKVMMMDIEHFPLFVLSAILPWLSFSTSLFDATPSIVRNGHLLNQFTISREILPIASVAANFINFSLGLIVMLPVFIIFNPRIIPYLLFLPVIILFHFVFTVGIGLLLSCVNVFLRDIWHLLEVGLMFWFWVTPIFYSIDMVPARFQWVCRLNPMTSYITMYRNILFEARMPSFWLIITVVSVALVALFIGYKIFIKYESFFLKRI